MTRKAERSPAEGTVPDDALGGDKVTSSLQRRREAAWRLPPLADGIRDPLDQLAGLPIGPAQECHGIEYVADGWRPCCRAGAA